MGIDRRTILKMPLLAGAAATVFEQQLEAAGRALRPQTDVPALFRFGVMGDGGSGDAAQMRIAAQMRDWRKKARWELALSLGDNVYENGETEYFDSKFLNVYEDMLADRVPIHSTLGNHDVRNGDGREMIVAEGFGFVDRAAEYEVEAGPMLADGKRLARFICLNSNAWINAVESNDAVALDRLRTPLRERLARSDRYRWNIAFFHHPIHCHVKKFFFGVEKGHGSSSELQQVLEPELRETVDVVLVGHDHFFQQLKPQHGVHHIVSGGAGKLRSGSKSGHSQVEFGADEYHFMDFSLTENEMRFQVIDDEGLLIHAATLPKRGWKRSAAGLYVAA
jgi:hypothetical protein